MSSINCCQRVLSAIRAIQGNGKLQLYTSYIQLIKLTLPHSTNFPLLHKELHENSASLWIEPSIQCPLNHGVFKPTDCFSGPALTIHWFHLVNETS